MSNPMPTKSITQPTPSQMKPTATATGGTAFLNRNPIHMMIPSKLALGMTATDAVQIRPYMPMTVIPSGMKNDFAYDVAGKVSGRNLPFHCAPVHGLQPLTAEGSAFLFRHRLNAGRLLASNLTRFLNTNMNPVSVVSLSRNAMPIAFEIAKHLDAPLDVLPMCEVVQVQGSGKTSVLAVAVWGGIVVYDDEVMRQLGISRSDLADALEQAEAKVVQLNITFRQSRQPIATEGRTVILVDDVPDNPFSWGYDLPNAGGMKFRFEGAMQAPAMMRYVAAITALQKPMFTETTTATAVPQKLVLAVPAQYAQSVAVLEGASIQSKTVHGAEWMHLTGRVTGAIGRPLVKGLMGLPDEFQVLYSVRSDTVNLNWYEQDEHVTDEFVKMLMSEAEEFGYVVTYEGMHPAIGGESLQPRDVRLE